MYPFKFQYKLPGKFGCNFLTVTIINSKRSLVLNFQILREKYGMQPTENYGKECPGGGLNPTDEFFRCLAQQHTAPENHQVGTCKMGSNDDPMAVVDPTLKVYGIEGECEIQF